MATLRLKEQIMGWQVMHDNLTPRLPDLPHLAADHTALAQVLTDAQDLERNQELAQRELHPLGLEAAERSPGRLPAALRRGTIDFVFLVHVLLLSCPRRSAAGSTSRRHCRDA